MKGTRKLKQKHIQDFLQDIQDFKFGQKTKIHLQQHMTPPSMAAKLLFYIYDNQPIQQYTVADIGVGTGMLMCGAIYLQADFVYGFQIDEQYIQKTHQMLQQKVEGADYELILANAKTIGIKPGIKPVDLVIMNPPFGTKQEGIDVQFLKLAMRICRGNIYSMHKSSTRKFIKKFSEEMGYTFEVLMQVKFPLKKRFKGYHKKQVGFTEVDIILLKPTKKIQKQQSEQKQKQQSEQKQKQSEIKTQKIQ